ncbi:hypothetical protein H2509_13670 [Stappia sp. F7233]|uniref:Uncharacterized protein n=1 Tax=Stappia albiluteola TaxID=2758565 RepID=A0A839AEQ5_9HYPH|nr:hypothetical protein [Stappia albiluteola]MBA5778173.1 hypothetical protein [Stappia albiluteola]
MRFLKHAALLFLILPAAVSDPAHARPDTRQMTCAQAQALVKKQGAVVMSTGQYTYNRFVSTLRYCDRSQQLAPLYAPTRDTPQCFVAYYCKDIYRPNR